MKASRKPIKVAILGTRGIPNRHGGFEQLTEYLAPGLVERGFDVTVYQSSLHDYQLPNFKGVKLIHCHDPEDRLGTFGQYLYDFNCVKDARTRDYDVLIQLGYTSSSVWGWYHPPSVPLLWNMDGLEWKREKYSKPVRKVLKWAEAWAARRADHLIADSPAIAEHLLSSYNRDSTFIAYGAEPDEREDPEAVREFGLQPYEYYMLMARMEPENSIETIIRGYLDSNDFRTLLVVGKMSTPHAKIWESKYQDWRIKFVGGIYDQEKVHQLRRQARLYFHGHTVGGTNPSLLEAMASGAWICAHENPFNRAILGENALFFQSAHDITMLIRELNPAQKTSMIQHNLDSIRQQFRHEQIIDAYAQLIRKWAKNS